MSWISRIACWGALGLVTVALSTRQGAAQPARSSCETCHAALADAAPEMAIDLTKWDADVHQVRGLGCVGCHGGNADAKFAEDADGAMAKSSGFVGRPERARLAEWCGRCHSDPAIMRRFQPRGRIDQVAEYRSSVHGQLNAKGDQQTATCVDCHGVHGILAVSNPNSPVYATNVPTTCGHCHADAAKMAPYGIPTDQHAQYVGSVHGRALLERGDTAAPACNDCHGNHGSVPPGVDAVANVCGTCHAREAELLGGSTKAVAFAALGLAECTACHGSHGIPRPNIAMLAQMPEAPCDICHVSGDPPNFDAVRADLMTAAVATGLAEGAPRYDWLVDQAKARHHSHEFDELFQKFRVGKIGETSSRCVDCHDESHAGYALGAAMAKDQEQLARLAAQAKRRLLRAERAGMEVSEASFQLSSVVDAQISLEVLVHTFDHADSSEFATTYRRGTEGGTAVLARANAALKEMGRRRLGLAVAAAFVAAVVLGIGLWIRQLERPRRSA